MGKSRGRQTPDFDNYGPRSNNYASGANESRMQQGSHSRPHQSSALSAISATLNQSRQSFSNPPSHPSYQQPASYQQPPSTKRRRMSQEPPPPQGRFNGAPYNKNSSYAHPQPPPAYQPHDRQRGSSNNSSSYAPASSFPTFNRDRGTLQPRRSLPTTIPTTMSANDRSGPRNQLSRDSRSNSVTSRGSVHDGRRSPINISLDYDDFEDRMERDSAYEVITPSHDPVRKAWSNVPSSVIPISKKYMGPVRLFISEVAQHSLSHHRKKRQLNHLSTKGATGPRRPRPRLDHNQTLAQVPDPWLNLHAVDRLHSKIQVNQSRGQETLQRPLESPQ